MAKYRSYERQAPPVRKDPHPVWRGIGCLIMLVVPVLSYGISMLVVQNASTLGLQIPPSLLGRPTFPEFLYLVPGLVGILNWLRGINNLYAILVGTFTIAILLTGFLALGYAFIYRIIGPPRYTELDAPTPNVRVRKYKR